MKTTTKHILTLALTLFCALGTAYAIDKTYYSSIDGKSGSTLRDALYTLTAKGPKNITYNGLWTAYKTTDVYPSDSTGKAGKIWDMYSNVLFTAGTNQCGSYSNVGDCYNREHSLPKSWFNEATPAYYDLGHIVPTDGYVNNQRSNYPFGECASGTRLTNGTKKGLGKLGTSTFSGYTNVGNVFEPDDIYKGDFARMYMYMAVRYKKGNSNNVNLAADSDGQKMFNSTDANFGFTDYSVALLMKWHRQDPVSVKEVLRNNGMEKVQGNRNPFIDYPDLAEFLWGNNQNQSVNLSSLTIATGGSSSIPTLYDVILDRNGVTETISTSGTYNLPTDEEAACDGWSFAGWSTNSSINTTTAPSFTTSVLSAATLYAVYSNTSSSSAPIRRTPAAVGTTMWAETWTGATTATSGSNNATPSANYGKGTTVYNSGTVTYTQSANTVYVRNENTGGGTAPELLLSSGKTWTISNIPTGEATELTLTYKSNNTKSSVTCSTTGASITGSSKSYTITTGGASTITLEFGCSGNTRIDDVSLTVKTAGSGSGSGGSTTTYKTTPDCGSAHTITLSNSGSVTGGTFDASATSAYNGATITLYADPSEGYTFSSWTVTKADGDTVTVNDNQFTMPDANVTVSATFSALQTYDIKFYNNGTQIGSTQSVYQGGTPNIPSVDACDGYTFVGWWTEALSTTNTASKSWITNFTVTKAQDYYAIFSKTVGGAGGGSTQKSIYLDQDSVSSSYGTDTEVTRCGVTCYYTNVMKSTSGTTTIQMKKSGSYIANKESLTKIDSIIINGVTTLTVFGGTSVKPETTTITRSNNKYDFSGGNYSYFKIKNATSGALYPTNIKIYYTVSGGASSSTTYYTSTTTCAAACTTLDAPSVTATPGNGQITLFWPDVTGADHYTVTIGKGAGYTTECGSAASIGTISHSGTTNTCIITGLTNGLAYTTTVVANASSSTCDSEADSDTTTPQECTQWSDPTLSWNKYSLNTTTAKTATVTVSGTTHGTLSFESSNTDVLTVDSSTGTVTAQGAGEATVTAHWTAADGYCEKTMTSQAFEVAGPLIISFNANGGTGTMTDQTVTYKVSTAIKDNSFTRTGYTFQGWALTADGEKVYNDKQSVAFTNSQTLYAVWMLNSHKVTFTPAPTGATVKVNNSSTSPVNNVNYGSTVTIAITPAEHYTVSALTVSGASGSVAVSGTGDTRTFTMPDEDVTVALTMEAESQYTATFHNGTATFATVDGYVDDDINAPTGTPSSCDDETFTFVGWVAAEQTTETTTMPEIVSFPQNMLSGGVDYYALFRRTEGGGGGEASVTFKTASSDSGSECTTDNDIKTNIVNTYTGIASFEGSKVYLGKSGVKLGTGSYSGSITLNLSSPITTDKITVEAVKYGTDGGNLKIEINGSTAFGSELSPADGTLNFTDNEVEISSLTILTTAKRAYVASISLGGGGTSYYTTAPECAVCESQVTITKGAETNGTFTLSKADGTYDNCKKNVSVIVSNITPADGYYCTGVTATGNPMHMAVSGPDDSGNYTVAYAKNYSFTSTITAHFEEIPTHTVTWSVLGGEESSSATYREGATIAFPADPTGCEDKEFVGWTTEPILLTDDAPSFVSSATMGTEDITFYAVFATATTSGGGSSSSLTKMGTGDTFADGDKIVIVANGTTVALYQETTNTSYVNKWTFDNDVATVTADNKKWLTVTATTGGWYLGDDVNGYINNKDNNLYCNSTKSVWELIDNEDGTFGLTSGRYLSYRSDLDTKYWRCGGTNGASGKSVLDIYKVTTASGPTTYSGYTTLCYEKYERTFNNVEDYATLCLPYSVNVLYLQGATAYSVAGKYVNNSTITGILLNEEETELAAGQSYVIQSTALTMNAWYSPRVDSLKAPVDTQGMVGNLSGKKIYVPVGCYGLSHNKLRKVASENTASIDHYKAYFVLNDDEEVPMVEESAIPQGSKVMHTTDDAPTALEQTNGQPSIDWNQPVYNILGIRVGKDATGVLIQNGIKYLR